MDVTNDNVIAFHGSRPWFQRTVQERARSSGSVVVVRHAQERMTLRDIALDEVLRVLRCGMCQEDPQPGHGSDWRAKMVGAATGREIVVVAAVSSADELVVVVTVWLAGDEDLGNAGEGGA